MTRAECCNRFNHSLVDPERPFDSFVLERPLSGRAAIHDRTRSSFQSEVHAKPQSGPIDRYSTLGQSSIGTQELRR